MSYRVSPELQQSRRIMAPVNITPVTSLMQLREMVLSISEKRCPKWHFRLDADLVIELQARPGTRPLFLGTIIQGHGIRLDHFKSWTARHDQNLLAASFEIRDALKWAPEMAMERTIPVDEQWAVRFTRWGSLDPDALVAFKARALKSLTQLESLEPSMMFQPACLCCGKALTDPVSMARWAGPECSHNHTLYVGRWFKLSQPMRRVGLRSYPVSDRRDIHWLSTHLRPCFSTGSALAV